MSGHSKWHNIREKKSKVDAKKGQIFTKAAKEIFIAIKEGGGDPETNYRLKMAIQKAKEVNMPADNIKRAIEKAQGQSDSANYEEVIYEGYGPNGIAVILEVATDNRNRTAAELRTLFSKNGGNLGETGCVAWMFEKVGLIIVRSDRITEEELMEFALDNGAEDVRLSGDSFEVISKPANFHTLKKAFSDKTMVFESAEITMLPKNTVSVSESDKARSILRLMDALDDHDDVQNAYANFDISEEILNEAAGK